MDRWDVTIESGCGNLSLSFTSRDEAYIVWNLMSNQWRSGTLLLGSDSSSGHSTLNADQVSRVTLMSSAPERSRGEQAVGLEAA